MFLNVARRVKYVCFPSGFGVPVDARRGTSGGQQILLFLKVLTTGPCRYGAVDFILFFKGFGASKSHDHARSKR